MHRDGRSWRQLANILAHLPSHSRYMTAQRDDPELAEFLAQQPESKVTWTPPAAEWSLLHELLAANIDRLGELIATLINVNSSEPIDPPDPFPRPRTEIEKARYRREQAEVEVDDDDLSATIFAAQAFYAENGGEPPTDN